MTLALLFLLWQQPAPRPGDIPAEWRGRIGEYGPDNAAVLVFEKGVYPVVKVVEEKSGEVLYAVRVTGPTFQPTVFAAGKYTIAVGRDKPDGVKLEGVEATADKAAAGTRKVKV